MSNLLRWDPLRELNNLRDNMNRILEEGLLASVGATAIPVDMYETDTEVIIETGPFPGVRPENIEVSITGNVLTLKGTLEKDIDKTEGAAYIRKERRMGDFSRSVTIPRSIKAEKATANYKSGLLIITIPKAEDARPKVINIEPTNE